MGKFSRRLFIKEKGLVFALPLLSNLFPLESLAAARERKNFIGIYFPNGSIYPNEIGSWHWNNNNGVLTTLKGNNSVENNVMILRKMHADRAADPHFENTANFLSGHPIVLNPSNPSCGKSIDQYIADKYEGTYPHRSLVVGDPYFQRHDTATHRNYSPIYLNRISWQDAKTPITPLTSPDQIFKRFFAGSNQGQNRIDYLHSRKQSILDLVFNHLNTISRKTSSEGKLMIEKYEDGLRTLEKGMVANNAETCQGVEEPNGDFSNQNQDYSARIRQYNRMITFALKCKLTNVATMMMAPAISKVHNYTREIGSGSGHHAVAHAQSARGAEINRVHLGLLKDLIQQLKSENLIEDTLVLYGSDMSNGNHATTNIPTLLCGGGNDLKFGQDINFSGQIKRGNLLLTLLSMYGINLNQFGGGKNLGKNNFIDTLST